MSWDEWRDKKKVFLSLDSILAWVPLSLFYFQPLVADVGCCRKSLMRPPFTNYIDTLMASTLEVQIMPTTGSLYEQGFYTDYIEVEPGETFKIDKKYKGTITCEEVEYIFWDRDEFTNLKEQADADDTYLLRPGSYLFHDDGITIEKVK